MQIASIRGQVPLGDEVLVETLQYGSSRPSVTCPCCNRHYHVQRHDNDASTGTHNLDVWPPEDATSGGNRATRCPSQIETPTGSPRDFFKVVSLLKPAADGNAK